MAVEKKQPVNLSPEEFFAGPVSDGKPVVVGSVSYDHDTGDILMRIPAEALTWENSRPTSNGHRREFVVVGDIADRKMGLPGYVLYKGQPQGVKFSNPQVNLFFSRVKAE